MRLQTDRIRQYDFNVKLTQTGRGNLSTQKATGAMNLEFDAALWYWRGPAPYYFAVVPEDHCRALKAASKLVTYGWGMIPVRARIGETEWKTSLFPKDGGYLVPIKDKVRKALQLEEGHEVTLCLEVGAGKPARVVADSSS
jgi:Domain of unknown function (DUF1905)